MRKLGFVLLLVLGMSFFVEASVGGLQHVFDTNGDNHIYGYVGGVDAKQGSVIIWVLYHLEFQEEGPPELIPVGASWINSMMGGFHINLGYLNSGDYKIDVYGESGASASKVFGIVNE